MNQARFEKHVPVAEILASEKTPYVTTRELFFCSDVSKYGWKYLCSMQRDGAVFLKGAALLCVAAAAFVSLYQFLNSI